LRTSFASPPEHRHQKFVKKKTIFPFLSFFQNLSMCNLWREKNCLLFNVFILQAFFLTVFISPLNYSNLINLSLFSKC
jgi:hypothetical protein